MLQAMNTGHDGSLTPSTPTTPETRSTGSTTMVAMANLRHPERAVRQQIASAVTSSYR
jgi:pilus assembly protein CpaF